jgi:hypothetical protein
MEAGCRGTAEHGGISISLLPDATWKAANPCVTIPIATGLGVARNAIIAQAFFCLVAIDGGYGTLSEIAFGLQFGRPVFALPRLRRWHLHVRNRRFRAGRHLFQGLPNRSRIGYAYGHLRSEDRPNGVHVQRSVRHRFKPRHKEQRD